MRPCHRISLLCPHTHPLTLHFSNMWALPIFGNKGTRTHYLSSNWKETFSKLMAPTFTVISVWAMALLLFVHVSLPSVGDCQVLLQTLIGHRNTSTGGLPSHWHTPYGTVILIIITPHWANGKMAVTGPLRPMLFIWWLLSQCQVLLNLIHFSCCKLKKK